MTFSFGQEVYTHHDHSDDCFKNHYPTSFITLFMWLSPREEDSDFMDEYDKQIEMRSDRNGNYFFIGGFNMLHDSGRHGRTCLLDVYYNALLPVLWVAHWATFGKIYYYRRGFLVPHELVN